MYEAFDSMRYDSIRYDSIRCIRFNAVRFEQRSADPPARRMRARAALRTRALSCAAPLLRRSYVVLALIVDVKDMSNIQGRHDMIRQENYESLIYNRMFFFFLD